MTNTTISKSNNASDLILDLLKRFYIKLCYRLYKRIISINLIDVYENIGKTAWPIESILMYSYISI